MLNLGVIGTNWISDQFVDAAEKTNRYTLKAVYSRTLEKAEEFGEKYHSDVNYYEALSAFFADEAVDVVYIASPNSMHFAQAKAGILAGKHVIVEKPAVTTVREMQELVRLSNEQKVCFFEAARHIHETNFQLIKDTLKEIGEIIGGQLIYMKYSSRYDLVLQGEEPNIFSLKYSGGALMDLGIYLVYAAVAWFGVPKEAHYDCRKISTGVDGIGTIRFKYPTFNLNMLTGKIGDAFATSEIYGTLGTITMDSVTEMEQVRVYHRLKKEEWLLPVEREINPMMAEATDFAQIIENRTDIYWQQKYQEWQDTAIAVNKLLNQLRQEAGIQFLADTLELENN